MIIHSSFYQLYSRFDDVRISFVAVSPSTGEISTGSFDDAPSRSNLETKLALINVSWSRFLWRSSIDWNIDCDEL